MTETQLLIERIRALSVKMNLAPATVGARVLGGGQIFGNLEAGKTITLAKYERAKIELAKLEAESSPKDAAA